MYITRQSLRLNFLHWAALLLVSAWLWPSGAVAQKGQTSMGTDFWMGFMPNSFGLNCCPPENCVLYIGTGTANDVHVDVYGGSSGPVETYHSTMTPNSIWTVPARSEAAWEDYSPEEAVNFGIHVYSKNPVVVYGYQYTGANTSSTDSYLAIPTPALGTEYYPACYYDDHYTLLGTPPLAGQFLIISPYDNNLVTIGPVKTDTRQDPNATTILHHAGDTWNITLMKGQTYLVQSTGLQYGDADLTGTHITSTKPIGLISGHQLCSIPIGELAASNGSKDEVMEMVPPIQEWGTQYYDMPTATRVVCGDLIRVIAGQDNVTVTLVSANRNQQTTLLHAGDYYDFDEVVEPSTISSQGGEKFLAVQMAYSQNYDGDPGLSDPFSIVLTPKEQFQNKMIFRPPDRTGVAGFVHYGTFLCEDDSILHIMINGEPITFYPPAGHSVIPGTKPLMGCYRIQFPGTSTCYVASCGSPFACYLYGWSQYESYGHPAGMALGIPSPDTLPPLEKVDSSCTNFQVEFLETRHEPTFSFEDTKISDIQLITDSLDPRWPKSSHNFVFSFDPSHPFTSGDSTAYFDLNVIDPTQDAYAAVWTTDKAGNDTVYQYYYIAPKLRPSPTPFEIAPVRVTDDSCEQISFVNTGGGPITVASAHVMGIDTAGTFKISPTEINRTIKPGDSVTLQLCFTPSDTLLSFDTLFLAIGKDSCTLLPYPLSGIGTTPLIIASDLNFGNVTVGDTICKPVTVRNVGKAPLTLGAGSGLGGNADFSFSDSSILPVTIPPGATVTLEFCFHPQDTGAAESLQNWSDNLPGWFVHSIKDTSQLLGVGVKAELNWNRPSQGFVTECGNPVIDTVYLVDPLSATAAVAVDSVQIHGPDAAEFSIIGMQYGSQNDNVATCQRCRCLCYTQIYSRPDQGIRGKDGYNHRLWFLGKFR